MSLRDRMTPTRAAYEFVITTCVALFVTTLPGTLSLLSGQMFYGPAEAAEALLRYQTLHTLLIANGAALVFLAPAVALAARTLEGRTGRLVAISSGFIVAAYGYRTLAYYPPFAEQWIFMALFALGGLGLGGAFTLSLEATSTTKRATFWAMLTACVAATCANELIYPQTYEAFHASLLVVTLGVAQCACLIQTSEREANPSRAALMFTLAAAVAACAIPPFVHTATSAELSEIDQHTALSQFTKLDAFFIEKQSSPIQASKCDPARLPADADKLGSSALPSNFIEHDPFSALAPTRHVLLITVESLRYDHTSLVVEGAHSGALRRWAARGISFSHAYSPSPKTLTSISSYMTLKHPSQLDLEIDKTKHWLGRLSDQERTLAEAADEDGRATFAAIHGRHIGEHITGLDQGFEDVTLAPASSDREKRDADEYTLNAAMNFIDEKASSKERFFGWVFFVSPHRPYYQRNEGAAPTRSNNDAKAHISEVAYAEGLIDTLLKHLESHGLLKDTMVIITGDHGEATGEHEMYGHRALYEHQLRVPFIVLHPGAAPASIQQPAQTLHALAWSISTASGSLAAHARARLEGDLGLMASSLGPNVILAETISENSTSAALTTPDAKVIWSARHDASEFFSLERDPKELSGSTSAIEAGLSKSQHTSLTESLDAYTNTHACGRVYSFGNVRAGK